MYFVIAALLLIIVAFLVYLQVTGQHVHFHSQNTSYKEKPEPTWRNGRCWFSLSYNDESKSHYRYPSPTIHPWWHLFHKSDIKFKFDVAADEHDLAFYVGFLFGSIGVSVAGTSFFRWLFRGAVRMGWGYSTGIDFDPWIGHLTFMLLYNDMSSGPGWRVQFPRWYRRLLLRLGRSRRKVRRLIRPIDPLPNGIHFWRASDWSKNYPTGGGLYLSFDFDRMLLGSFEREVRQVEPRHVDVEVPIEPDNSLGFHYFGSFGLMEETRWRGHFPWKKTVKRLVEIEFEKPPLHSGKGENSYDLDDDGIFGWGPYAETIEEAIKLYQEAVYQDRKRYGLPGVIYEAQRGVKP